MCQDIVRGLDIEGFFDFRVRGCEQLQQDEGWE